MEKLNKSKGISTPVGILIILVIILLAGGIIIWQFPKLSKEEMKTPEEGKETPDETADLSSEPIDKIIDCGTNLDCFINASKECKPAKVIYIMNIPVLGISGTSYLEIQGIETSKCILYLRTEKKETIFPAGYPQDTAEMMKRLNEKLEGKDGICKFEINDLVSVLEKWKEGSFSFSTETEGLEGAEECRGEMFEWYRQRVKTYSTYNGQILMRELLIKDNPEILNSNKFLGPEYYRIFEESQSPHSDKVAILFGLDSEKTKGCCSEPIGLFLVIQGKLGNNYKILKGDLEHQYLANIIWDNENLISYNVATIDEGGKTYREEYLKAE